MARRRKRICSGPEGILLVNKPVGPTSRDIVNDLRRRLDLPSPGHCGTLDPLASGLLVMVSGCATRLQDRLTGHSKEYLAEIILGAVSVTDDREGPIETRYDVSPPRAEELARALESFVGEIEQVPPLHSAIRVGGERLYEKARRGETSEVPARRVIIHSLTMEEYDWPRLKLVVSCASGTYIRSLARDLGQLLGCGGYLGGLVRTRVGQFHLAQAVPAETFAPENVLTLEESLGDWPAVEILPGDLPRLLAGREVHPASETGFADDALIYCQGQIVARARKLSPTTLRMKRLIRHPEGAIRE